MLTYLINNTNKDNKIILQKLVDIYYRNLWNKYRTCNIHPIKRINAAPGVYCVEVSFFADIGAYDMRKPKLIF